MENIMIDQIIHLGNKPNITLLEAVVEYCEQNDLDIESVAPAIKKNPNIMSRLREEAEELNYLEKRSRLPL